MRKIITYVCLPLLLAFGQNDALKLSWDFLKEQVVFTEKYNKKVDLLLLYPTFTDEVRKYDGKLVEIKGYMIESDVEGGIYVLSRYPMAECYFCGGAGPESVIEVQLKSKSKRYLTDQMATVKGVFRLNDDDVEHCNYILKNAEVTLE